MSIPSYLGYGYRSFLERTSEKLFGERVFDLPDDVPSGGSTAEIGFGVVATEEDFQSAFSVDAEVSGGYGKLSGHANFALRQQFSRQVTTVTVALTKRIVKGTYRIDI